MKKLILVILFLLLPLFVFGADQNIYLDNGDAGVGTEEDPYGAFAEINWSTGGANSIFDWVADGDDVFINLKRGISWDEDLLVGTSGASGHPITIQAYSTGALPILLRVLLWARKHYITIKNIQSHSTGDGYHNMDIAGSTGTIVDGCVFDGEHRGNFNNIIIHGHNEYWSENTLIKNSVFMRTGQLDNNTGGAGVASSAKSRNTTVDNCTFYEIDEVGVEMSTSDAENPLSGLTVKNCRFYGYPGDYVQGSAVNAGWYSSDVLVENNYVENWAVGIAIDGFATAPIIIRNNTIINSRELMALSGTGGTVYQNVLLSGADTVKGISIRNNGHTVMYNIISMLKDFWPSIYLAPDGKTYTGDYNYFINPEGNIFWDNDTEYYNLVDWRTFTGQEDHSIPNINMWSRGRGLM